MRRGLVVSFVLLLGCSGGGKKASAIRSDAARATTRGGSSRGLDGGTNVSVAPAGDGGVAPDTAAGGRIAIRVLWLGAGPQLLASPGRNACKAPIRPPLSVHHMGGVRGAFVWLEPFGTVLASRPKVPVQVTASRCSLSPSSAVLGGRGGAFELINDDEQRHLVTVEHLGDGSGRARVLRRIPLPLVGQRVAMKLADPGIVRVGLAGSPATYTYLLVPRGAFHAVTDRRGEASFGGVPPGTYQLVVWHPPVAAGSAPRVVRTSAVVSAGAVAKVFVSLAP